MRKFIAICVCGMMMVPVFAGCAKKDVTVGEFLSGYSADVTETIAPTTAVPTTEYVPLETEPTGTTSGVSETTAPNETPTEQTPTGVVTVPSGVGLTAETRFGFKSWYPMKAEDYSAHTVYPMNARISKAVSESVDKAYIDSIYAKYNAVNSSLDNKWESVANTERYCVDVDYNIPKSAVVSDSNFALGVLDATPYSLTNTHGFFDTDDMNVGLVHTYCDKDGEAQGAGDSYTVHYLFTLPKGQGDKYCMQFTCVDSIGANNNATYKDVFGAIS